MYQTTPPSLDEMKDFVSGSASLTITFTNKSEAYSWINTVLVSVSYMRLRKPDKGIVRAYLVAVSGYQSAQVTRLIKSYCKTGTIVRKASRRRVFPITYTREDILCLVEIDNAHDRLSGYAVAKLCRRAYVVFGDIRYERLAGISVSHIYNLRDSVTYRNKSLTFTKTQATKVAIGERRKPSPDGRAGYIRVDTVHQGDKDGEKGVYHVNLVDEVTQWEVVIAVEKISEKYMVPALELAMSCFPFLLTGFHADNGSEYINQHTAELLERLRIKLTKSRAYHSGDNGLVETKNGAVIRKALGYGHISQQYAPLINNWYQQWFIPYLNYHRPCGYRTTTTDPKTGKRTHKYLARDYLMPYEKLMGLATDKYTLRESVTFEDIEKIAYAMNDTDWAIATLKAKERMLTIIDKRNKTNASG